MDFRTLSHLWRGSKFRTLGDMAAILLCALPSLFLGLTVSVIGSESNEIAAVDRAIAQMAGRYELLTGKTQLYQLPADLVINAVVQALEANPGFQDPGVRRHAYEVLKERGGVHTTNGFAQLVAGLNEKSGREACMLALEKADSARAVEAASALITLISESQNDSLVVQSACRSLVVLGAAGRSSAGTIYELLSKEGVGHKTHTYLSSAALAAVGPLEFLSRINRSDSNAIAAATIALAGVMPGSKGIQNQDDSTIALVAEFYLWSLGQASAKVQQLAIKYGSLVIAQQWFEQMGSPAATPSVEKLEVELARLESEGADESVRLQAADAHADVLEVVRNHRESPRK